MSLLAVAWAEAHSSQEGSTRFPEEGLWKPPRSWEFAIKSQLAASCQCHRISVLARPAHGVLVTEVLVGQSFWSDNLQTPAVVIGITRSALEEALRPGSLTTAHRWLHPVSCVSAQAWGSQPLSPNQELGICALLPSSASLAWNWKLVDISA